MLFEALLKNVPYVLITTTATITFTIGTAFSSDTASITAMMIERFA